MIKKWSLKEIRIRDPFIYVENDLYYLYGTTDYSTWEGPGCGFDMYKSEDMETFEGPYQVFKPKDDFWGKENFWAPEVVKYHGKYYMTASFKGENRRGVQVLQSNDLEGPFEPLINKPITPQAWDCLDGHIFVEEEKVYLVFCHEWTQIIGGEICVMPLTKDLKKAYGECKTLFKASDSKWAVKHQEQGMVGFVTDGPFIYRLQDSTLAMIWSSYSKTGYSIGIAYSQNGIYGPWFHDTEPLYKENGGHGMLFKDKKGILRLVIHSPNSFMEERVKLLEMVERDGRLYLLELHK